MRSPLRPAFPHHVIPASVILTVGLLCTQCVPCRAQEFWKHFGRPDVGLYLSLYQFSEAPEDPSTFTLFHLGAEIGLNIPIVRLAEHLSLGVNPGVGISAQPAGDTYDYFTGEYTSSTLAIDAPAYATLKYNTDASWKGSKSPVGFTAGVGAHYNAFFFLNSHINAGYIQPSYLLEINFGSRSGDAGLFKVRWTSYIGKHEEVFEEFDGDLRLSFHQFALNLLWVPGY